MVSFPFLTYLGFLIIGVFDDAIEKERKFTALKRWKNLEFPCTKVGSFNSIFVFNTGFLVWVSTDFEVLVLGCSWF